MELRKLQEKEFHNLVSDQSLKADNHKYKYLTSNKKFYSIVESSRTFAERYLIANLKDKKVLDYCCGNGNMSVWMAKNQASEVIGIDISEIEIENCKKMALEQGVEEKTKFIVMDAEEMEFDNNVFDIIYVSGVLHHLDLQRSYPEMSRVLRPDGVAICIEALGHNQLINLYRKMTPQLRTEWETQHILKKKDIEFAKNYFGKVEILGFFHLAAIGAVPFRNLPGFKTLLTSLEAVDSFLTRLPLLKWQAWQVVFQLSQPLKVENEVKSR